MLLPWKGTNYKLISYIQGTGPMPFTHKVLVNPFAFACHSLSSHQDLLFQSLSSYTFLCLQSLDLSNYATARVISSPQ